MSLETVLSSPDGQKLLKAALERREAAKAVEDPYVEESTANPERVNNGCMIYKAAS